jgi:hypothetical protein
MLRDRTKDLDIAYGRPCLPLVHLFTKGRPW